MPLWSRPWAFASFMMWRWWTLTAARGEVGPEAPCAVPLGALGAGGLIELAVAILASSLFVFLLLFLVPFPFHSLFAFEVKLVFGEARLGRPLSPRCVHALWALVGGSRCRVEVATANAAV